MAKPPAPKNNELALEISCLPQLSNNLLWMRSMECFYIYTDDRYYQPADVYALKRLISDHLLAVYAGRVSVTASLIDDIFKQLAYIVPSSDQATADHYISFTDCLLCTDDLTTRDHTREIVATLHFPFAYSEVEHATSPVFDKFLTDTLVLRGTTDFDKTLEVVLQEMVGNLMLVQMDAASCFFLVGGGANGKSVLANLIASLFGKVFVSAYSIEALTTDKFAASGLVGKRVNICNEEESRFIKHDKFKAIISGDLINAQRKFGATFEFCPTTKFLFCSNNLPTFEGIDWGVRRRIKIIPFNRFFDHKDRTPNLTQLLLAEIPGVLRWALVGMMRLQENNFRFSDADSPSMQAELIEFENEMSSALAYFREHWEPTTDTTCFVSNQDMFDHYAEWCKKVNRRPLGMQRFHNDLVRMLNVPRDKCQGKRGKLVKKIGEFDLFLPSQPSFITKK